MNGIRKGFTVIELLISVTILTFAILAVSFLFTQAQWLHLGTERRSDVQNHARVVTEALERDLRMIGYGVPTGTDVGGVTTYADKWDAIFAASSTSIGFTADIDDGNTILTANAGSTAANEIVVETPAYYSDVAANPLSIILVKDRKSWIDLTVNGISGSTLTTSVNITSPSTFSKEKSEIYTLERVFYRMTGDANNNGICDSGYPYCTIERQEFTTNNPGAATETPNSGLWETLGEDVFSFSLQYQNAAGTVLDPSVATNLPNVAKIVITLVCRDKWIRLANEQNITLTSHVLVRNRAL